VLIIFKIKETHPHHHHINLLLIITILLIIIIAILVKPALLGYKISKQFEEVGMSTAEFLKSLDSTKSKLLVAETNLESCKSLNNDLVLELSNEKNASFSCMQEKNAQKSSYESLVSQYQFNISMIKPDFENQKKEFEIKLEQEKTKAEEAKADYDALVENAATNLCCKARVDNKEIDSYIVSNNRIVCATGEKNKVSC